MTQKVMDQRQLSGLFSMNQRNVQDPGRGESRPWIWEQRHGDVWSWNRTPGMGSNGEVRNSATDAEPCGYRYPPPSSTGVLTGRWISENPMETGRGHCKRKAPLGSGDEGSSGSRWRGSGYSSSVWDHHYHPGCGATHNPIVIPGPGCFTSRNVRGRTLEAATTGGTFREAGNDYLFNGGGAHHPRSSSSIRFTSAPEDCHVPFQQDNATRYYHQHSATRPPPFAYWRSLKAARQPTWSAVPASSSSGIHPGGYHYHHGSSSHSTAVPSPSPDHFPLGCSRLMPTWWNSGVRGTVSLPHGRRFHAACERQRFHHLEMDLRHQQHHHLRGDQHVNMRLDVDNMTYEELLALGDQIGVVCTGLSHDVIPDCLSKATLHDDMDGRTCAICLEEYLDGDEIGTIKSCAHDYHVPCITKWLTMKNVCPICKAPALAS